MDAPLPSPSGTSIRSTKPSIPLLSLAPPALALGDELAVGEPGDDNNAGEIWNVITRAADLVKDGERLENLAWRHWGQPRRSANIQESTRRLSMSSQATTASSVSASIHTPIESHPIPFLHRTKSAEKLSFGGALKLLLEKDENNFKDWIEDAKKHLPPPPLPTISVPDTPIANVEIRLVEPTPVPSRVGSLGGSMSTSGLLSGTHAIPPALKEDVIGEEKAASPEKEKEHQKYVRIASTPIGTPSRRNSKTNSPKKKNSKFFVQSSPGKGSGSDSSHPSHTSPVAPTTLANPQHGRRRSSGDSSSSKGKLPELNNNNTHPHGHGHGHGHGHQKRHVSLSTMRGKYHAEKRRMAEQHSAMNAAAENENKDNEESGWEDEEEDLGEDDEDENWSDEEDSPKVDDKAKTDTETQHQHQHQDNTQLSEKEKEKEHKVQKPPLNRRRSSSKSRPKIGRTVSDDHPHHHHQNHPANDLLTLLTSTSTNRRSSTGQTQGKDRDAPPPPAPTPLTKMSKKERQKAAAERAKIEAQLEAQRQREMFAKQQIFGGRANQGLLASALQRGASMVNLQTAADAHSIRPSPTHCQLPSLASSPAPGPALLRSKSVVAMPVQTGVSVTIPPHALDAARDKEKKTQKSSQEKAKAAVELESSDDEETDADAHYLNTTQTKQKLAALAAKRDAKSQTQQAQGQPPVSSISPTAQSQPQQSTQALPAGPRVNEYGYVQPMTPTTRRRNIIMAEMSESLRRNVVLEREKSSGGGPRALGLVRPPPSTHTSSKLSTHRSAVNLTQYSRSGGGETMERTSSHPARASPNTSQPSSHTGAITTLPPPPSAPQGSMPPPPPPMLDGTRRRTTPNILGGGFLRPLTRATIAQPLPQSPIQNQPLPQVHGQGISRNSSTTNLNLIDSERSESPSNMEAPAMMRRSTEGDGLHKERERRRELARRRDTTDTSYRLHGW
uniref:Nitrogen regulatory protein areA GATA-like domain-containing protein n=1 Tax=Kwoniella bestiolae CBS 10118 TaxID=1296100 RepID=A0A1B9FR81_9TREE|nr:hypothetical protein I302_08938 [Kwoniella bestiolae CBS 10118]OCF21266.1 hypothetical protein I302_08938 [Kwoniella bestiolae CBS 10118]